METDFVPDLVGKIFFMNPEELKKYRERNAMIVFQVTSKCNDNCPFCIEKKFIKRMRDDLSLEEIKKNFNYLKNRFNKINYIVISGGESTLHENFFGILDFFRENSINFRFATNFIKLSEKRFFRKLLSYLGNQQKDKIVGSIHDLPFKSAAVKKRVSGLKNVLLYNLPLMLTVVIYKENLGELSDLISYLSKLFKQYNYYNQRIIVEIRLIYAEGTLNHLLKKSLPRDFKKVQKAIHRAVLRANDLGIAIMLWNFPLCYLKILPRFQDKSVSERRERIMVKVNKDLQEDKIKIWDFDKYLKKNHVCTKCKYDNFCSGIDNIYLEKYHFPPLRIIS